MGTAGRMAAAALLMAGWGHSALAEGWSEWKDLDNKELQARCEALATTPIPVTDLPSGQDRKDLAGCGDGKQAEGRRYSESVLAYYGADGVSHDYAKARKCAIMEQAKTRRFFLGGPGVLMMLYANGQGVARNFDLARRMVCDYGGAVAELEGRLRHLELMEAKAAGKPIKLKEGEDLPGDLDRLDVCDDGSSGALVGYCTALSNELSQRKDQRDLVARSAGWPPAQQAAFVDLRRLASTFAHEHARTEILLEGSIAEAYLAGETSAKWVQFLRSLDHLEKGAAWSSKESFAEADKRLNQTWNKIQGKSFSNPSTTTQSIKQTQLLWLKYRDAYAAFAALRYPDKPVEPLKAWLTRQRITDLRHLPLADGDPDALPSCQSLDPDDSPSCDEAP